MIFQIIGAAVLLVFYGCYFAKLLRQRRRGVRTDQLGRGKQGRARTVELSLKAVSFLAPLAEIVSILGNWSGLPDWASWLGSALAAAGALVFAGSMTNMGESWRAGVPKDDRTRLVTGGLYRFSRNPAFLGFDLVYLGELLLFFNWPLLAVSLAAMVTLHLQITLVEEPYLRAAFGQDYIDYAARVGRYLGRKPGKNR